MDWIGAILDSIREMECPCCGARLASCAVRGVTAEPNALIDAHEFLQRWHGTVTEVLAPRAA